VGRRAITNYLLTKLPLSEGSTNVGGGRRASQKTQKERGKKTGVTLESREEPKSYFPQKGPDLEKRAKEGRGGGRNRIRAKLAKIQKNSPERKTDIEPREH